MHLTQAIMHAFKQRFLCLNTWQWKMLCTCFSLWHMDLQWSPLRLPVAVTLWSICGKLWPGQYCFSNTPTSAFILNDIFLCPNWLYVENSKSKVVSVTHYSQGIFKLCYCGGTLLANISHKPTWIRSLWLFPFDFFQSYQTGTENNKNFEQ